MRTLACCVLLATGCAKTDSSDLLTSGIYGQLSARTLGDGKTYVDATLFVGNPINLNFVELTGDDRLIAKHAGTQKTMTESQLLNVVSYGATFDTDLEGEQFEISLLRSVDAGAPSSTMTLPAKFDITAPPATASRAAALTLTWSPSGATETTMSWLAEGECIERQSGMIQGDTGTAVIAPETIRKRMGEMIPDQCAMTVTLTRTKPGQLDRGYGKGGIVSGQQQRKVMITSMP